MKLVIVESPTKAKTLSRYLDQSYRIVASMGHIRDLPKEKLSIDIEHDFQPTYEVPDDKKKIVAQLKTAAKGAKELILATDPDREGEAIAYHIAYLLTHQPSTINHQSSVIKRITFHEITKAAILEALKNPGKINQQLVDSQQARRVLDRLVGYKLSPLLWSKVRRGLSAGRVQSITVRLIVEREREINQFQSKKYWTISVKLGKNALAAFLADLVERNNQKYEKTTVLELFAQSYSYAETSIGSESRAQDIISDLQKQTFVISDIQDKQVQRQPYGPLTTSTLQQAASRVLGLSSKRTMQIAQGLYERGLITYHRTDSMALSLQAVQQIRKYITNNFGPRYLPSTPRIYKTKTKNAQEAHEAIRPTNISNTSKTLKENVDKLAAALYDLIHRRTLASQMAQALFSQKTIKVQAGSYGLSATGIKVVFDGFLKLYPKQLKENNLPDLALGDKLKSYEFLPLEHQTQPPPRYNEASLIKTLETKGIGRPSTYAPTLSLIQTRQYVEKNEGNFIPTTVGIAVNDFLVKNFDSIINIPFTAQMEDDLDTIAAGEKAWVPVIRDFYKPFANKLTLVSKTAQRIKIAVEKTGQHCPLCKEGDQVIRIGRFGKFLSCSRFPECKWTGMYAEKLNGIKCPDCGNDIVLRKTKRGRQFYGCSQWPKCKWASWHKPHK